MTLFKSATFFVGTFLLVSLTISPAYAQSNDNDTNVRQHRTGSMIKLQQPMSTDSVTIQVIDSATASQNQTLINNSLQGKAITKRAKPFDVDAFMGELLKKEKKTASQPPVSIRTQGGQDGRVVVYVKNRTSDELTNLSVTTAHLPKGWQVRPKSRTIKMLPAGHQQTVAFDLTAPSEQPQNIDFKLASEEGTTVGWSARITAPESGAATPPKFQLHGNYPNPFNPTTTISYSLPQTMNVQLTVYNVLGQKIATLINSDQQAGVQNVSWDASRVASGTYIYRIVAEAQDGQRFVREQKMVLIK